MLPRQALGITNVPLPADQVEPALFTARFDFVHALQHSAHQVRVRRSDRAAAVMSAATGHLYLDLFEIASMLAMLCLGVYAICDNAAGCYIGQYMRGTRWLLLLAILAILVGIGVTYHRQRRTLR